MQVFLYAVLDDASRLILHAQFYSHQGLDTFLDCLRQAVAARGVCTRLSVDAQSASRAKLCDSKLTARPSTMIWGSVIAQRLHSGRSYCTPAVTF
jgi:hypothetical protein